VFSAGWNADDQDGVQLDPLIPGPESKHSWAQIRKNERGLSDDQGVSLDMKHDKMHGIFTEREHENEMLERKLK
jgi:hypothetical protein